MKIYEFLRSHPTILLVSAIVFGCLCVIKMIALLLYKLKSDKRLANSAFELNRLTNSIHAGIVQFIPEEAYDIYYASKGFYELLGYSRKETKESNKCSILDFIYLEDKESFTRVIQSSEGDAINFEIRLVKNDGKLIYCLITGNYSLAKDGSKSISSVIVDITEQKKMQETLRMDRERYRIASELSHDVLFEYYIDIDKMVYTDKYLELFGRNPIIFDYIKESHNRRDLIHPDDYGVFLEYCCSLNKGEEFITAECRLKDRHSNYIWCQIMGKTIYSEDNRPSRVIGKLINIDYQKRELDALEYKATRDPLTGVYNREVTIKKIEKYIDGNKNGRHVLMFIDFDDFKRVNNNYGHLIGDKVLIHVIGSIRSVFSEGEIIGRIGGDEFMVFMGNVKDKEAIVNKAEAIIDALNTSYVDDNYNISISGSVGISTYPEDGIHYEQLIQCADKAMYHVKNRGKNNYQLYSLSL